MFSWGKGGGHMIPPTTITKISYNRNPQKSSYFSCPATKGGGGVKLCGQATKASLKKI